MAQLDLPTSAASPWAPGPETASASPARRPSYSPLDGDLRVDVTVIGAGITGLSTAVMLKRAGLSVAVLEARHIGAAATGHTTAKISLLQGTRASTIARSLGDAAVRDHVAAHRVGMEWLLERAGDVDCDLERRTAVTYSTGRPDGPGPRAVRAEAGALRAAGVPVELGTDVDLPYPVSEAVSLPDQVQFDPVPYLYSLAAEVHGDGSSVHEHTRVRAASWHAPSEVRTDAGRVHSAWVVVATGVPILDRSLHFARVEPSRSYSLALRVDGPTPPGMYLSADSPGRSIRTARHGDERLLLVGGNGHRVGTSAPMRRHEQDLLDWADGRWPVGQVTHRWSAQDYQSEDGLPFIGPIPLAARALVAFGFAKWGMTGGSAAAIALTDHILGQATSWLPRMRADRVPRNLRALSTLAQANGQVARYLATGWARPHLPRPDDPAEGEGRVETTVRGKVARCRVDGRLYTRSAVCPHLGGILEWNNAESSWDCPLHASRFAPDGQVLEGPATRGLTAPPGLTSIVRPRT